MEHFTSSKFDCKNTEFEAMKLDVKNKFDVPYLIKYTQSYRRLKQSLKPILSFQLLSF